MWVFYVNRGQGIVSCGVKDKNHSILEFFPANKAWQLASLLGFRTFLKVSSGKKIVFYEPFHNGVNNLEFDLINKMSVSSPELKIEERNLSLGLEINIDYFTVPGDSYAALVRIVTLKNTKKGTKIIELLDGLPQIVPYGTSNLFLKKLGRTIEAWMNIKNLENLVPFYKLDVDPTDRPEVMHIKEGNFYLAFYYDKGRPRIVKPVVDPQSIFGTASDFTSPLKFLKEKKFIYPYDQITKNKIPCGFSFLNLELSDKQQFCLYSLVGYMRSQDLLNSSIPKITSPGYLNIKKEENKKIIEDLQWDVNTQSDSKEFDLYTKQTYIDNIMRGGYPLIFESKNSKTVFYLYSRKHGDLERDYNKFHLEPTYFSQGNGNYRDINQNRRCDVWLHPEIKEDNLITFFSLLQTDGFNPLVVDGKKFTFKNSEDLTLLLNECFEKNDIPEVKQHLDRVFSPGEIILFIEENKIRTKVPCDALLNMLLARSTSIQEAEHGDGFWTDHWTYNLDLLESYLDIYPEGLKKIIFDKKVFTFFDNTEIVRPRHKRYVLKDGRVRQLHALVSDTAKKELTRKRAMQPHLVRMQYGRGEIYKTSLINKLLCLMVNKLASLDPFGTGIEMEADKPNWYDALNGLPSLLGSSICETLELKRLIIFIKDALEKSGIRSIPVTEEVYGFLAGLSELIRDYFEDKSADKDFRYWDRSNALKEEYREQTRLGLSGKEAELETRDLIIILDNALRKLNSGIDKALDKNSGLYWTYFINEVAEYETLQSSFIKPKRFTQKKLPVFLESQMHALRLIQNKNEAQKLYKAVRQSTLFDKKLKMYKVTSPLLSMPHDIGRCRAFTPGWLENESIWLHMEYKFLLEVLKFGLYEEFFTDFKNVLIPFQAPQRYGRSILENSSFIVSSAFPDKNLHGNGFVARLSGSTVEFLHIWMIMNMGKKPFRLDQNGLLNLEFKPILPGWLFTKKDKTYGFNFLSKISVVYHNPKRKNTYGKNSANVKKIVFNDKGDKAVEIISSVVPAPFAEQIRSCLIKRIDIYLD